MMRQLLSFVNNETVISNISVRDIILLYDLNRGKQSRARCTDATYRIPNQNNCVMESLFAQPSLFAKDRDQNSPGRFLLFIFSLTARALSARQQL